MKQLFVGTTQLQDPRLNHQYSQLYLDMEVIRQHEIGDDSASSILFASSQVLLSACFLLSISINRLNLISRRSSSMAREDRVPPSLDISKFLTDKKVGVSTIARLLVLNKQRGIQKFQHNEEIS